MDINQQYLEVRKIEAQSQWNAFFALVLIAGIGLICVAIIVAAIILKAGR